MVSIQFYTELYTCRAITIVTTDWPRQGATSVCIMLSPLVLIDQRCNGKYIM